jgi:hypothetical protein
VGIQLADRASAGGGWLTSHLHLVEPWTDNRLNPDGMKALGEVAFVAMQVGAWASHPRFASSFVIKSVESHAAQWSARTAELIEQPWYVDMCWKQPTRAYDFLLPYFCLRALGYDNVPLDTVTRWLLERQYLLVRERPPFRLMEFSLLLGSAGYAEPPGRRKLLRQGSLPAIRDPLYLDIDDVYSLTHILMYVTDLCREEPPLSPAERRDLGEVVQCLLVDYARRRNWDLLGELLIAFRCLRLEDTPLTISSAQTFMRAWQDDGSMDALGCEDSSGTTTRELDHPNDRWARRYHTTLVAIMFAVLWPQNHAR